MPKYSPEEKKLIDTYLPKNSKRAQIDKLLKSQRDLLEKQKAERLAQENIEKSKQEEKKKEKEKYEAIKTRVAEQIEGRMSVLPAEKFLSRYDELNFIRIFPPQNKEGKIEIYLNYNVNHPERKDPINRFYNFRINRMGGIPGGHKKALPDDSLFKEQNPEISALDIYKEIADIIESLDMRRLYPIDKEIVGEKPAGEKPVKKENEKKEKKSVEGFDRKNHRYFMQRSGTVCCFYVKNPEIETQLKDYNFYLAHEGPGQDYLILETDAYGNAIYCIGLPDPLTTQEIEKLKTGINPEQAQQLLIEKQLIPELRKSKKQLIAQGNRLMIHPPETPQTTDQQRKKFYENFETKLTERRTKDLQQAIEKI
jgi:hypothetical protein